MRPARHVVESLGVEHRGAAQGQQRDGQSPAYTLALISRRAT